MTRQYDAGAEAIEANLDKHMSRLSQVDVLDPAVPISIPDRALTDQRAKHHAASPQWRHKLGPPRVRLQMPLADASALADVLSSHMDPDEQRILDQLWLRTVLIEQWRRARVLERSDFELRADQVLAALDP